MQMFFINLRLWSTESESFLYDIWSECLSVYVCAHVLERADVYKIHKQVYVQ